MTFRGCVYSVPLAIGLRLDATTRCRRTYDAGMARLVGINHVALEVDDREAVRSALAEAGITETGLAG